MKSKKILSVLMAATMVAGTMMGCGDKTSDNAGKATAKKMDKTPITFTFYDADLTEDLDFTDDVAKEITKQTGVTLKYTHPVGGDTQAVPLMIASGDYPDLIFAKGDTGKLVDAGALVDLSDYMNKEGDNIKKLYGNQVNRLKYSKDDESIYSVGTYGAHSAVWGNQGWFSIANDILKEQGYPQVKTLDDYEKVMREYVKKHPTTDGKKTTPLVLYASDTNGWIITGSDAASISAGIPDDGSWAVDDNTGKATYKFFDENVKAYFKWLNKLNADGLIDPESFTAKKDAYLAKISSGKAPFIIDANWDYNDAKTSLVGAGQLGKTYANFPLTTNANVKDVLNKDYGFGGGFGVSITTKCKDKERAFQFLDWTASDEAQVLLNWGIKGKHYTEENGVRKFTPEIQKQKNSDKDFSKKTGIGKYNYPMPEQGDGVKDSKGMYYTANDPDTYKANYNDAEKETLKAYKKELWSDFGTKREELGTSKHGQAWQYTIASDSDLAIIQKKADDYAQKATTNAILGKTADFDKNWDEMIKKIKDMGMDKAESEMTKLVKEKTALWK